MTFYQTKTIRNDTILTALTDFSTSTDELLKVRHAGAGRINGKASGPVEGLPCGLCEKVV
jgi:hypothetical protein